MQNVLKKLFEIQQELKVPKNQRNTFGNYNFRNCEDIMEASKPVCAKHNCLLTCSDELVQVGDRYYVKSTATLFDLDSGEFITTHASAREEETKKGMDQSQITGASSSYARKYALNGLLQLDDNKDADTNEYKKQQEKGNFKKEMITPEQIKKLQTIFSKQDGLKEKIYSQLKIKSSKELTKNKATSIIKQLEEKGK